MNQVVKNCLVFGASVCAGVLLSKGIRKVSKEVRKMTKETFDNCRELGEVVMETAEKRNKAGEIIMGVGVAAGIGLFTLGLCISDHRPGNLTAQERNNIRAYIKSFGWILVAAGYFLPSYVVPQPAQVENDSKGEK